MQLRAWARRTPRRYGIWKVYLVSDLFYLLDITKRGVLGLMSCFIWRCSQARKATLTNFWIALHTLLIRGALP